MKRSDYHRWKAQVERRRRNSLRRQPQSVPPAALTTTRSQNRFAESLQKKRRVTKRFSISETNDAAVLGLQEAISPDTYKPNDVGYTHGISLRYKDIGRSLFGLKGALAIEFDSDLITEFSNTSPSQTSSFEPNFAVQNGFVIRALDVYQLRMLYESHPLSWGGKFFFGPEYEHITDTPSAGGLAGFISGQKRQRSWHGVLGGTEYEYTQFDQSRESVNAIVGIGFERPLMGRSKIDMKLSRLQKYGDQQAEDESKFIGDIRLSFNETVMSEQFYLRQSNRFTFALMAHGEYGEGERLDVGAELGKNFLFRSGHQFELTFSAFLPLEHNFFDYSDFTTPSVVDDSVPDSPGILDDEPVYTLRMAFAW